MISRPTLFEFILEPFFQLETLRQKNRYRLAMIITQTIAGVRSMKYTETISIVQGRRWSRGGLCIAARQVAR
jgi:hypothetical protein